jgi:hypothetical protein
VHKIIKRVRRNFGRSTGRAIKQTARTGFFRGANINVRFFVVHESPATALDVPLTRPGKSGEGLAVSDITLLEIATLQKKGRITLESTLETFLAEVEIRFVILPITGRVCVRAAELPAPFPADPADRSLGPLPW